MPDHDDTKTGRVIEKQRRDGKRMSVAEIIERMREHGTCRTEREWWCPCRPWLGQVDRPCARCRWLREWRAARHASRDVAGSFFTDDTHLAGRAMECINARRMPHKDERDSWGASPFNRTVARYDRAFIRSMVIDENEAIEALYAAGLPPVDDDKQQ